MTEKSKNELNQTQTASVLPITGGSIYFTTILPICSKYDETSFIVVVVGVLVVVVTVLLLLSMLVIFLPLCFWLGFCWVFFFFFFGLFVCFVFCCCCCCFVCFFLFVFFFFLVVPVVFGRNFLSYE